ncbi:MAG TPA: hypothetical protein VGF48_24600 [Thermoanaerobaculia bacterium]|jgi:hypothetical protein
MTAFLIDHPHNEASALLGIQNPRFLAARGWESGFWVVSDEEETADALAVLGRTAAGAWEVVRVQTRTGERSTAKKCEDCESLSRAGSRVYIFGSQYGTKKGPLEPKRHFVGRFNEALLDFDDAGKPSVELDLVRRPFALHRIVNDALRGIELLPLPDELRASFIGGVDSKGKSWKSLLHAGDAPINVEGSTFVEGGRLLLGLRYPVTRDGHPIIVEIEGIDRLFERDAAPPIATAVRILTKVGDARRPAGIRELDARGGWVHAITGDLDDELLGASPEKRRARSEHWAFRHVYGSSGVENVEATRIRTFPRTAQVEGIALDRHDVWYVHDDEKIRLEQEELQLPE